MTFFNLKKQHLVTFALLASDSLEVAHVGGAHSLTNQGEVVDASDLRVLLVVLHEDLGIE